MSSNSDPDPQTLPKAAQYFERIALAKRNTLGQAALNSLDIIDTKAGGLAGLIGGFSAAAMIAFGVSWNDSFSDPVTILLGMSLLLFGSSGISCAFCLRILSHWSKGILVDLPHDGSVESGMKSNAEFLAGVMIGVYQWRVQLYLLSHWLLVAGIGFLFLGTFALVV